MKTINPSDLYLFSKYVDAGCIITELEGELAPSACPNTYDPDAPEPELTEEDEGTAIEFVRRAQDITLELAEAARISSVDPALAEYVYVKA